MLTFLVKIENVCKMLHTTIMTESSVILLPIFCFLAFIMKNIYLAVLHINVSHNLHYSLIWISSKSFYPIDICLSEKRLVNKKNNWKRKLIMTAILIKTVMFFWKLCYANLFNIILRRDFNVFMSINWNVKKVKVTLNKINMSYFFTKLLELCTLAPTWIVFHIFGYILQ